MRTVFAALGLAALLLTVPLVKANALTSVVEVSPDNVNTLPYTFVFTNGVRDGLIAVGVTITPKKGSLSPGLLARVHLKDEKTELATIPLEETRENGKVTYWFHVTPALVAKSRFEFDILSGIEKRLPNGKTVFIAEPGTLEYLFNIRDFVPTKQAAKPAAPDKALARLDVIE